MERDLKDALKYISDQGYGIDTNWNTKLVAVLLANYANKLASDGHLAEISVSFADFILEDYEMAADEETDELVWAFIGTKQRYSSKELYERWINER